MPFERYISVTVRYLTWNWDYGKNDLHSSQFPLWVHAGKTFYDTVEDEQLTTVVPVSFFGELADARVRCSGLPGDVDVPHDLLPALTTTYSMRGLPGDDQLYLYCHTCKCLVRTRDVFTTRTLPGHDHYQHWWRRFFAGRTIDGHTFF